jgi:hypothetical protein
MMISFMPGLAIASPRVLSVGHPRQAATSWRRATPPSPLGTERLHESSWHAPCNEQLKEDFMSVGYPQQIRRPIARPHRSEMLRKLARFGYLAKGVVYALIGVLALLAAFGEGGQVGGGPEAVRTLAAQPFGMALCVAVGIGLLAYAGWRFAEAALDLRSEGTSSEGIAKRLGYAASGLMNGAVGVLALDIVIGSGSSGSGGDQTSTYVGKLMQSSAGSVVVALIGLGFVLFGLAQIAVGYKEKFVSKLHTQRMNETERKWTILVGKAGYIARGIVFPIIGIFLIQAVLQRDPSEATGLGGALRALAAQPFGQVMLVIVAFGLACYGAYQIVFAKYGRLTGG